MCEQHQRGDVWLELHPLSGSRQRDGHVRRRDVRMGVQRGVSQLRRGLREQHQCGDMRLELYPLLTAHQCDCHVQRRVVRMGVQRGVPRLRRKLREQCQHGDVRLQLHPLFTARQRNGHLQRNIVWLPLQLRLSVMLGPMRQHGRREQLRRLRERLPRRLGFAVLIDVNRLPLLFSDEHL